MGKSFPAIEWEWPKVPFPFDESRLHRTDMTESRLDRNCSVARTLEIMGDPWGFLIIRALFFGMHRFNEILEHGAIPKKILAARLKVLLEEGVLRRRAYETRPRRYEYLLTEKGHELYLPAIALMRWGDRWTSGSNGAPVKLRHNACGRHFHAVVACSECRQELNVRDVSYRDGPGAGTSPRLDTRRHRRSPSPEIYQRGRLCSVARTLSVVADRWLFLIMREACFGIRRFDDFHHATGIARNILTDRLEHLVESGLLKRHLYHERPERFEYRLADEGRSLYPPILAIMAWGDRWQSGRQGPPLLLTHKKCGKDFHPVVVCSSCGKGFHSRDVTYKEMLLERDSAAPTKIPA
jgi:DNA-binding HxlR family transcriptional regulator